MKEGQCRQRCIMNKDLEVRSRPMYPEELEVIQSWLRLRV